MGGCRCEDTILDNADLKTRMSIKSEKSIKEIPNMCRLGRTLRDKNEGGV